jgi:hypothetical protein
VHADREALVQQLERRVDLAARQHVVNGRHRADVGAASTVRTTQRNVRSHTHSQGERSQAHAKASRCVALMDADNSDGLSMHTVSPAFLFFSCTPRTGC